MERQQTHQPERFDRSPSESLRESLTEAIRYWEPRRLVYNLVLGTVAIGWVVATWPHFRPVFTLFSLLRLAALALLANVCYCAAYVVDIPLRLSALSPIWSRRRWVLWLMGTLLAFVVTNYWIADEIYPFVR